MQKNWKLVFFSAPPPKQDVRQGMVEQPIKLRKNTLLQLFARNIKLLLILLIYGSGLDLLIFRTYMEDKICFFLYLRNVMNMVKKSVWTLTVLGLLDPQMF